MYSLLVFIYYILYLGIPVCAVGALASPFLAKDKVRATSIFVILVSLQLATLALFNHGANVRSWYAILTSPLILLGWGSVLVSLLILWVQLKKTSKKSKISK